MHVTEEKSKEILSHSCFFSKGYGSGDWMHQGHDFKQQGDSWERGRQEEGGYHKGSRLM